MKRPLSTIFFCLIGIAAAVLLNYFLPLTFSCYFIICTVALALCFFWGKTGLLIPWTITATASVLITLNYLHPDITVYSNADYHVLAMQGVDHKDSVILIDKDRTQSFFDHEKLSGRAYITPSKESNGTCIIHYLLPSEALFAVTEERTGRLLNKQQMPSFHNRISLQNDSLRCDVTITQTDSTTVTVQFAHQDGSTTKPATSSFKEPILIGYNLYDILHNGISYNEQEERLLDVLRDAMLVRDFDDLAQGVYHLTYPTTLEQVQTTFDGKPFTTQTAEQEMQLDGDTYFYIGIGSQATRPMKAYYQNGNICLRYQFPYLSNFPGLYQDDDVKENQQKTVAVTTQTKSLLKTNVNEAFYYPLFGEANGYNFNGNITYRVNDSHTPFTTELLDNQAQGKISKTTLTTPNGSVWHFQTYNLRQESPITGKPNPYVNDLMILGVVFLIIIIAFFSSRPWAQDQKSSVVMMAWLFAIPLFIMRIYLLWRIAVFPPVTDITLNEFLRYRMELSSILANPMALTIGLVLLLPLTLLLLLFLPKKWSEHIEEWWDRRGSKRAYIWLWAALLVAIIGIPVLNIAAIHWMGLSIFGPVVFFLINEYVVSRGLNVYFRIGNALVTLGVLFVCDPGYSIMFFIFLCVYYTILLYGYLKYHEKTHSSKKIASRILLIVLTLFLFSIIWLPAYVSCLYSSEPTALGISTSRLSFILLPSILGIIILTSLYIWVKPETRKLLWALGGVGVIIVVTAAFATYGYDEFQNKNLHFKYRTIIHQQTVGDIMKDERYDHRNAQRLLNAAQNQWFLQYHLNKGDERVNSDGIITLLPHFKKGVTWNTQISDVILSRYVIGELSSIVPLFMILLVFVFLFISFHNKCSSPAGRAITYAVGLLFLIQSTFEWMAVTNRTIFFGQDFPFMSQNARITLLMFTTWLIFFVYFTCHQSHSEYNLELRDSLNGFTKPVPQAFFTIAFLVIFCCIFKWGNSYESLYANKQSQGDKSNAEEFNISAAMRTSNDELKFINLRLAEYPITGEPLENNQDISALVQDIEEKTQLSAHVQTLKEDGQINEFTYSLYQAFIKNLKKKNSNHNIIHLRHQDQQHYELALNKAYFSMQSPDFDQKAWRGNVYTQVSPPSVRQGTLLTKLPGMFIYTIPGSWLPKNMDGAIADCRVKNGDEIYHKTIHKQQTDYDANIAVFPITPQDLLEFKDRQDNVVMTYQYGREEQNLLVKNMVINGKRKFFYPLKEKIFWLRDFSNLVAYSKQGSASRDAVFVTLDGKLTESVQDSLRVLVGKECSVVALDGLGNVRLMADYKPSVAIDPNNEELIEELGILSYMNPNSKRDENLFGNLNLCYLQPGPGSSLKPITYAAVISQNQDMDWAALELMSPKLINNDSVASTDDRYYYLRKFGPQYRYAADRAFKSLTSDEAGYNDKGWISNDFYLAMSSNYYNALITYLGHYDNLKDAKNNIFVVSTSDKDYPRFRTEQGGPIYTFKDAPEVMANQILFDGLTKNFKMSTFTGYTDSLRYDFVSSSFYKNNDIKSKHELSTHFSWVFPQESSIFDYELRNPSMTPAERLRQYALGASPVKVTPMKMAEMYGRLYALHPDFHASVIPNETPFTEPWLDRNGTVSSTFVNLYRQNVYRGMQKCVQEGTAKYLTQIKGYYLYAKTGTLSLGANSNDDRMLAVIISNRDLTTSEQERTLADDHKFMVVYFRFKQLDPEPHIKDQRQKTFWRTVNAVMNRIVDSSSFKIYMNKR